MPSEEYVIDFLMLYYFIVVQIPIEYSLLDIVIMSWQWIAVVLVIITWEWYKRKRSRKKEAPE